MDRSEILNLIEESYIEDEYGVLHSEPSQRTVYCDVGSVSASEIFEGGRNGLNPEIKFTMFRYDYKGEKICEFKDRLYTVYRTYVGKNETIELYCEKRKGTAQ